jgi:hypothetical protein
MEIILREEILIIKVIIKEGSIENDMRLFVYNVINDFV